MRLFLILLTFVFATDAFAFAPDSSLGINVQQVQDHLEGDFGAADIAATNSWVQTLHLADWLGPLAPVAISPFFGMACLSGMALYGPEWVTNNALLGASGPLQNEWLFVTFLVLTLLTSLPRLSKVSKPFAQAMDQLETYSVIIILLAIKLLADFGSASQEPTEAMMVQLGVFSMSIDALLMFAMAVNIVVVSTVKFFFEFLVWLTPIPMLDAVFEICNKTLCAALMAVYAFSPTIATIINLVILLGALIVFRWVSRQVRYYRTMLTDPVLAKFWKTYATSHDGSIIVFPVDACGPFSAKSRLRICCDDDQWTMQEANWWMPSKQHVVEASDSSATLRRGWVMHTITLPGPDGQHVFKLSRRYDSHLDELANQLGITIESANQSDLEPNELKAEFA